MNCRFEGRTIVYFFGATFVPALHQLDLHISKTCSVYTYRLGSGSKCICDLMYLECPQRFDP